MKHFFSVILYIITFVANAQTKPNGLFKTMSPEDVGKMSYNFEVSYNKTSHIIFPSKIIYVDAGSSDIVTSTADNLENVLRVKANVVEFLVETNLTVATDDGNFWSFIIKYNEFPAMLNIDVRALKYTNIATSTKAIKSEQITYSPNPSNMALINSEENKKNLDSIMILTDQYNASYATERFDVIKNRSDETLLGDQTGKVKFKLLGLYSVDDFVIVKLKISNNSKLDYRLEKVRFWNVDSEKRKNVSYQEIELMPTYAKIGSEWLSGGSVIGSKRDSEAYFMLPIFAIAQNKELAIQFSELLGGRTGEIKINYNNFYNIMQRL